MVTIGNGTLLFLLIIRNGLIMITMVSKKIKIRKIAEIAQW